MKNIRTLPQLLVRIFIRPVFPFFQWLVVTLGIIKAPPRQEFLLGKLRENLSFDEVHKLLRKEGFYTNRIAFIDPGQVLSMRRLDEEKPDWQYHIRIFEDGEIRGHYEKTPEDHPFEHLNNVGFENRANMFSTWTKNIT
tara:strand:+ start:321938 stop:322354 length:417 start_codon:yes stop_codon:yes gene_type:complete